ncbi:MAG TPA: NRAMP family divalent metal transporter [Solirubrobacteraceae bacterium]|nr:NRAMP family divalent metal transporter [Solirubrobacteraceae bacterium]
MDLSEQRTMKDDTRTVAEAHARAHISPPPPGVPPVLDEAHVGDIRGALGTLSQRDSGERRSFRGRLLALLAIIGPGLIVMVGDNDAGGVSTYLQAGQEYGPTLLWTLILLIPVLIVNQEMVVRLGAVTGVGHGRLIKERFGRFWSFFSIGDLFILNFLTIVTEFIGVSLVFEYFGISRYIAAPVAACALFAITAGGGFRSWERTMLVFIAGSLLVIPLFFLAHPQAGAIATHSFAPGIAGGVTSSAVLLIIAIVGTTVAPWQLFFQQSNVIDKRITTRWINYERADTVIGAFVVVIGAGALMSIAAFGLGGARGIGHFINAAVTAHALAHNLGSAAGALLAIVLLNASLIGAAAVTLSTSYAFGDVFGLHHSLHRSFREARFFYSSFGALVLAAMGIVLIPSAPLGVITEAVQALAGVLLPSATVFLLLLCNDREVLGPWVNPPWLNAIASLIVTVLVGLSLVLVVATVFPSVNVTTLVGAISALALVGLALVGLVSYLRRPRVQIAEEYTAAERRSWTMPPLALLEPVRWSPARRAAMMVLRLYLVIAIALMVVKATQIGR